MRERPMQIRNDGTLEWDGQIDWLLSSREELISQEASQTRSSTTSSQEKFYAFSRLRGTANNSILVSLEYPVGAEGARTVYPLGWNTTTTTLAQTTTGPSRRRIRPRVPLGTLGYWIFSIASTRAVDLPTKSLSPSAGRKLVARAAMGARVVH